MYVPSLGLRGIVPPLFLAGNEPRGGITAALLVLSPLWLMIYIPSLPCTTYIVPLRRREKLLTMDFEGQMAVDVVLFILAAAFSLVSIGYIAMLWSLRRNFFIVMR